MSKTYASAGIQFIYPEDWELTEERGRDELTVSVNDGGTAQWSITLLREQPDPRHVLDQAVQAFREEYDELDIDESTLDLADQPALAVDLDFACFELLNSAFLRAFSVPGRTVLVLYQMTDHELEFLEPIFEAINSSLKIESAGD
ncbi:MAG: hypothetical protein KF774_08295 [Planctomyces sp.]|nr:hypothetical protein [Planctomyces sp.]